MKKTNIRINNNFLIKKNDQYFLSDITNQDQWINTDNLVNHKGKNITSKLQELKEQYITKAVKVIGRGCRSRDIVSKEKGVLRLSFYILDYCYNNCQCYET